MKENPHIIPISKATKDSLLSFDVNSSLLPFVNMISDSDELDQCWDLIQLKTIENIISGKPMLDSSHFEKFIFIHTNYDQSLPFSSQPIPIGLFILFFIFILNFTNKLSIKKNKKSL